MEFLNLISLLKHVVHMKGILPKVYARPNLDKTSLGGLIDLVGDIALGDEAAKAKDIIGRVYEYFLSEFAAAEGKKGGQFYTAKSLSACGIQPAWTVNNGHKFARTAKWPAIG